MKIMNEKKTHFMKKSKCGLYLVKYDTVEIVSTASPFTKRGMRGILKRSIRTPQSANPS